MSTNVLSRSEPHKARKHMIILNKKIDYLTVYKCKLNKICIWPFILSITLLTNACFMTDGEFEYKVSGTIKNEDVKWIIVDINKLDSNYLDFDSSRFQYGTKPDSLGNFSGIFSKKFSCTEGIFSDCDEIIDEMKNVDTFYIGIISNKYRMVTKISNKDYLYINNVFNLGNIMAHK